MQIDRLAAGVVVQAPAKLNLFFEVLAKRDDGYHEIETLMCPVDLYDTLYFQEESSGRISLQCERADETPASRGDGLEELPPEGENLATRAVELLRQRAGVRHGATLRLIKRIPIAAGLGGGSSDAAAALAAANAAWGLCLDGRELAEMAAELGSDVPFFLGAGPAVCRGRGERIEPIVAAGAWSFVVVRPPGGLSTADVYAACRPAAEPKPIAPMLEAAASGDTKTIGRLLFNRLQPAAIELSPWIERLEQVFEGEDVLGHAMSGSGTSYFALCRDPDHARRVAERIEATAVGTVFAVRTCR